MITEHADTSSPKLIHGEAGGTAGKRTDIKQWARRGAWAAIALLPMSVGWAMVPRWSAFTSPVGKPNPHAIAFTYPSEWPRPQIAAVNAELIAVDMSPRPPQGWRGWWDAQILQNDFSHWNTAHVSVEMFAHPRDFDATKVRQKLAVYCAKHNKTLTINPLDHPLEKGFQVEIVSPGYGDLPTMISRNYFIFPAAADEQDRVEICVFCAGDDRSMPQMQAVMERIMRSVRVTTK